MADPATTKPKLDVHPVLAGLTQSGQSGDAPVQFAGYVGPASRQGQVRLYHSLYDLSHYIEFDEASVVQTGPSPENITPNQGVAVWVKAGAPVRWTREYKSAKSLAARIATMAGRGRRAAA